MAKKANLNKNNAPGEQQEAKFMEELTNSANVLNDVFDDIDQGLKFYQTLIGILLNLDKNVQDFCMAREMEKNCLLQEITQRMAGMNFQGGYKPNY